MTPEAPDVDERFRFSPSKLKAYQGCEQRATYHYLEDLRIDGKTTEALQRGKIVHRYLELWMHDDHLHPNDAMIILLKEFPSYQDQMLVAWGNTIMIRYINKYGEADHKRYKLHGVEERMQTIITTPKGREVTLDGIIDAKVEDRSNGKFGPWDHKTSGRNLWTKKAVVFDMQLNFYSILLAGAGYPVSFATINQIYSGIKDIKSVANTPIDKLFSRHTIDITPTTIEYWTELFGTKIDKIIDGYDKPKDLRQDSSCVNCPYYGACELKLLRKDPTMYIDNILRPMIKNIGIDDLADMDDEAEGLFE